VVNGDQRSRTQGHTRGERLVRILDYGNAAGFLHRGQARCPVVERPRQYNPDDSRAIHARRRSKQWINSWTTAVFRRAVSDADLARLDDEMVIRPDNIYLSILERIAVLGVKSRKPAGA
jgi:hypothetical protein